MADGLRLDDDPYLAVLGDPASAGNRQSTLDSRPMNSAASAPSVSEAAERYAADLMRTVDRLRTMGTARLAAVFEPEPTRADAAFALIQVIAQRAAVQEQLAAPPVPRLADLALGDQLAVVGRDLLMAARERQAVDVLVQTADELLELRRRI